MTERITDQEIEELGGLAKAARAGRWFKDDSPPPPRADRRVEAEADAAARLITRCDPETILRLLARLAEAEGLLRDMNACFDRGASPGLLLIDRTRAHLGDEAIGLVREWIKELKPKAE